MLSRFLTARVRLVVPSSAHVLTGTPPSLQGHTSSARFISSVSNLAQSPPASAFPAETTTSLPPSASPSPLSTSTLPLGAAQTSKSQFTSSSISHPFQHKSITARLELGQTPQLCESVSSLLPLLRSQPPHFIQVHIHGRPYLVVVGDLIRLPFCMPGVQPGDTIRLNCASMLGSRDFILKSGSGFDTTVVPPTSSRAVTTPASLPPADVAELAKSATIVLSDGSSPIPVREAVDMAGFVPAVQKTRYLDDRLFICRAVVLGVETEPLRIEIKKKQRTRRAKQAKSKHKYTLLRISEIVVQPFPETETASDAVSSTA